MRVAYALGLMLLAASRASGADAGADAGVHARAASAAPPAAGATQGPSPLPYFHPSIVHSRFGGQIFGFDVDQDGNEGVLSEALTMNDGRVLAAVEVFNQRSGAIVRTVKETLTDADDFLTLGVVGPHIGLVEAEHEAAFLDIERTYPTLDPLSAAGFNGNWSPPIDSEHIIEAVSRNQGPVLAAVYAYDNSNAFRPQVFTTYVPTGTFGPLITLTDSSFRTGLVPKIAYDTATDKTWLGIQTIGNPFIAPTFAEVDMQSGATVVFAGAGVGDVNGLAIDSATGRACATTEIDFSVEFYDVATRSGFAETLPGADNQIFSGADVAVDPIHRLFLVAQPVSSTGPGSSIHVFDEEGNLVESLDGFQFSNAGNVVPMHIALHPAGRWGFVDGPDAGVREIQSFTY